MPGLRQWVPCPQFSTREIYGDDELRRPDDSASKQAPRKPQGKYSGNSGEWVWLPVEEISESPTGAFSGRSFREFAPLGSLPIIKVGGDNQQSRLRIVHALRRDLLFKPSCYLGASWDWASYLPGSSREPDDVNPLSPQAQALYQLEERLREKRPDLSLLNLRSFWTSWQLYHFLAGYARLSIRSGDDPVTRHQRQLLTERVRLEAGILICGYSSLLRKAGAARPKSKPLRREAPSPDDLQQRRREILDKALQRKRWSIPTWARKAHEARATREQDDSASSLGPDRTTAFRYYRDKTTVLPRNREDLLHVLDLHKSSREELDRLDGPT